MGREMSAFDSSRSQLDGWELKLFKWLSNVAHVQRELSLVIKRLNALPCSNRELNSNLVGFQLSVQGADKRNFDSSSLSVCWPNSKIFILKKISTKYKQSLIKFFDTFGKNKLPERAFDRKSSVAKSISPPNVKYVLWPRVIKKKEKLLVRLRPQNGRWRRDQRRDASATAWTSGQRRHRELKSLPSGN